MTTGTRAWDRDGIEWRFDPTDGLWHSQYGETAASTDYLLGPLLWPEGVTP